MTGDLPSSVIAGIAFVGRAGGVVKRLGGFKKGHHTEPDAANATTNAFLGKICEGELASQAEGLFQRTREALGYKRKELTLSVASPLAVLTAKDFTLEIVYSLDPADPSRYLVVTTLHDVQKPLVGENDAFAGLFERAFTEISFVLGKGAAVESVIDTIEALDEHNGLRVTYPSDYTHCLIAVEGVEAEVRFTGAELDIVFPRPGSPRELIEAFGRVRQSFSISKELSGLIG